MMLLEAARNCVNLQGSGKIAGETSRAYDEIFTLSYVTGRSWYRSLFGSSWTCNPNERGDPLS
jgi:hypothetical protein